MVAAPFFIDHFFRRAFREVRILQFGAHAGEFLLAGLQVLVQPLDLFRGILGDIQENDHGARRTRGRLRIRRRHLRFQPALLAQLVRLSGTGGFKIFVATSSWIVLIRILAGFGTLPVAGYTIAVRIVIFALMPAWGLSNAAATMVGQGLGAGKPERAFRSVRLAGWWSALALGAVGLAFIGFAPWIVGLFTDDPETARWAVMGLRIVAIGFPFYGWGMVLEQSFNGAGDTRTPTLINIGCFWALELPAAWFLSRAGMGPLGVFTAIAVAYSAVPLLAGWAFRRGRWMSASARA